eukprot:GHVT01065451.1.p1 GENE.GHVT01065451.1~~GHVT01065451.1.p1  ORF type:complete len:394 (+),score=73.89 GHVT01065451.1:78-1259(+)
MKFLAPSFVVALAVAGAGASAAAVAMPNLSDHHSVMADILKKDQALFKQMSALKTSSGYTFANVINTGVQNKGHPHIKTVGAVVGDEECVRVFRPFYEKVCAIRHNHPEGALHTTDLDVSKLKVADLDPTGQFIISTRVRTGRSVKGFAFPPQIEKQPRLDLEKLIAKSTESLTGELKGKYLSLDGMDKKLETDLIQGHYLFQKPDSPLLIAGNMARDWPSGRGIYLTDKKDFLLWVNEEDHIRIISMQDGGNIKEVFGRFGKAVQAMEQTLKKTGNGFITDPNFGYILACPSNWGTGLRASVMLRIPHLTKHPRFLEIFAPLKLQRRGTDGVDSESAGGVHDISNSERLGKSEVQLVNTMIEGVQKLIELETALAKGSKVCDQIAKIISNRI